MNISRRKFVGSTAVGLISGVALQTGRSAEHKPKPGEVPLIVSTWPFGKPANDAALQALSVGGSILDAVEKGISVTESDVTNHYVGLSGDPNAAGVVQLDACIMSGPGHKAGSVAALEGIRHPISAARLVMEKTPHVMLVGEGARMFAQEQGLENVETNAQEAYEKWKHRLSSQPTRPEKKGNHDTIALLVLGTDHTIA